MSARPRHAEHRPPWPLAVLVAVAVAAVVLAQPSAGSVGLDRRAPVLPAATATAEVAPGVQLRIQRPAAAGLVPVLLHVPGGGWERIDETDVSVAFGQTAALDEGWAVATLRYRPAATATGVTARHQVTDVEAALAWIRSSGPAVGLLPEVVASGHSAGAHLLAVASARAPRQHQPRQIVLVSGVYDFAPDVAAAPLLTPVLDDALGCPPGACDPRDLRPASYAGTDDRPVTIVHATADRVTPVAGAERYADHAAGAGVPVTFVRVEGDDHLGPGLCAAVRRALATARASVAA